MQDKSTPVEYPRRALMTTDPRVAVIDAYSFTLTVRSGHLVIREGKDERKLARIDAAKTRDSVARIVILSHVGTVSMEVMRWCAAMDVPVFQVSRDGSIAFASPGLVSQDARLIKQQVLAQPDMPDAAKGLEITRSLLTEKIAGQLEVLRRMNADTHKHEESLRAIASTASPRSMLGYEGNAAIAYWRQWEQRVSVPWDKTALRYVPGHWAQFNGRAGTVKRGNGYAESSNRDATDFVNACLNYAYKICETEAMYACYMLGMHPGIGLSHGAIHEDKPAMALDIVEALRPIADNVVLSYLDYGCGTPFGDDGKPVRIGKDCAYELENGTCRLFPPMTSRLASAVSMAVAPHAIRTAERIAQTLTATKKTTLVAALDPRIGYRDRTMTLDDSVTVNDLVPEHMWKEISPLIPAYRHAKSDNRAIVAAIIAHEVYGVSWPVAGTRFKLDFRTPRRRLETWQESGVWEMMLDIATQPRLATHRIAG